MSKRILHGLLTIAMVAVLAALVWWMNRPEAIAVTVHRVARGTVETTVSNTRAGTVTACRRAKLSPSVGGQIAQLPVHEGDTVKQNQLLLELWNADITAEIELALREAQAAQASATAICLSAAEAQRDATRQRSLFERKLVSEEARDRAETLARSRAAECRAANMSTQVREARVAVVQQQLTKTRLLAPFEGVIAQINGELNEFVTPSPPGIPTPPAIDLIDTRCFYVAAPIDEVDVAGITIGQPARLTLDAFGKQAFTGKVRRIGDYVVDLEKQARTVEVEVEFSDDPGRPRLLAGYSADVDIILAVQPDVLRIPSEALLEGNRVYVFDRVTGRVQARNIRTGNRNWQFTAVLEGLTAGDQVVTNPDAEGLLDDAAARQVDEADLR